MQHIIFDQSRSEDRTVTGRPGSNDPVFVKLFKYMLHEIPIYDYEGVFRGVSMKCWNLYPAVAPEWVPPSRIILREEVRCAWIVNAWSDNLFALETAILYWTGHNRCNYRIVVRSDNPHAEMLLNMVFEQ